MPMAFSGISIFTYLGFIDANFNEIPQTGSCQFPLFPVNHLQTSAIPFIHIEQKSFYICQPKVVNPASIMPEYLFPSSIPSAVAPGCERSNPLLHPGDAFGVCPKSSPFPILIEGVSQKFDFLDISYYESDALK